MIKTDDMGEYNDEQIPEGVELPPHVDIENTAISFANNAILARYGGETIETSVLILEQRKAEFVCKLAAGELVIFKDKKGMDRIYRPIDKKKKGSSIIVEYEEVESPVMANV